MTRLEHKDPTPRDGDTPLGKIMGYMAELQTYLKFDTLAEGIATMWVLDFFPLGSIEGVLISIVQWTYENAYQNSYNGAADKGNEINGKIMGWLDDLKGKADRAIEDMKNYIDTEIIAPLRNKVNNDIMPQLRNAQNRVNDLSSDVSRALSDVETLRSNITGFDTKIKGLDSKLSSFDSKIKKFNYTLSSLDTRIGNSESTLNSLNTKIEDLKPKIADLTNKLSKHKALLENLNKRLSDLEGREPTEEEEKPFFELPKFLEGL